MGSHTIKGADREKYTLKTLTAVIEYQTSCALS